MNSKLSKDKHSIPWLFSINRIILKASSFLRWRQQMPFYRIWYIWIWFLTLQRLSVYLVVFSGCFLGVNTPATAVTDSSSHERDGAPFPVPVITWTRGAGMPDCALFTNILPKGSPRLIFNLWANGIKNYKFGVLLSSQGCCNTSVIHVGYSKHFNGHVFWNSLLVV